MHVVVSGAGPCGLLVALQLQLAGIRCTVLERAAESQLEADVGSGYEP
jgi:2-polyprenyl-6-methoxyphenol hydroxylase-like FAD-dependent oxidoreductase